MMSEIREMLKERTKQFSLRVIRLYGTLPSRGAAQVLGHQLLRSATSVGANYREAVRARSTAEFRAKLGECLKELEESAYWLELFSDSKLIPATKLSGLMIETEELTKIL
ncbi:MAG: four helix bundle protein [Verrucomicrobiota bacterium]